MKNWSLVLMVALAVPAFAEDAKKAAPAPGPTQQFVLISPEEKEALQKAAKAGIEKRTKDTLRHMYTAAALHGILANPETQLGDVTKNASLAKNYGYALMAASKAEKSEGEKKP